MSLGLTYGICSHAFNAEGLVNADMHVDKAGCLGHLATGACASAALLHHLSAPKVILLPL